MGVHPLPAANRYSHVCMRWMRVRPTQRLPINPFDNLPLRRRTSASILIYPPRSCLHAAVLPRPKSSRPIARRANNGALKIKAPLSLSIPGLVFSAPANVIPPTTDHDPTKPPLSTLNSPFTLENLSLTWLWLCILC